MGMDIGRENALIQAKTDTVRVSIEATLEYFIPVASQILLIVEAAQMADQMLINDRLTVDGVGPLTPVAGGDNVGRRTWMLGEGHFRAQYQAVVDVTRKSSDIEHLDAAPLEQLDGSQIPYLWPSRYCESDRLADFVEREFGALRGGAKIAAMAQWIYTNIEYRSGSSQGKTTAVDTFISRQGVCRDFAHLMAAFARAADIPARLVSAYALGVKPPDFHAVAEIWLDGKWYLIDTTRLADPDHMVRIAVGRDATDVAFMTIFGTADYCNQSVQVSLVESI
jgi:transglutaminase-like putative cysteine protease